LSAQNPLTNLDNGAFTPADGDFDGAAFDRFDAFIDSHCHEVNFPFVQDLPLSLGPVGPSAIGADKRDVIAIRSEGSAGWGQSEPEDGGVAMCCDGAGGIRWNERGEANVAKDPVQFAFKPAWVRRFVDESVSHAKNFDTDSRIMPGGDERAGLLHRKPASRCGGEEDGNYPPESSGGGF
jgi:hypothetical protein